MQSEFSIRVAGTYPAASGASPGYQAKAAGSGGPLADRPTDPATDPSIDPPIDFLADPPSGMSISRICRGARQIIWEVLVLTSGRIAERRDRRRIACHVRQIAMYVCHVALRMPLADIARGFGRDRSTVAHACHVVEDRRDDPVFDEFVAALERMSIAAFGQQQGALHD